MSPGFLSNNNQTTFHFVCYQKNCDHYIYSFVFLLNRHKKNCWSRYKPVLLVTCFSQSINCVRGLRQVVQLVSKQRRCQEWSFSHYTKMPRHPQAAARTSIFLLSVVCVCLSLSPRCLQCYNLSYTMWQKNCVTFIF